MNDRSLDIAQDGGLFPRDRIAEAVADADWRERNVPGAALFMLALGVTLLAWATPVRQPLLAHDVVGALAANARASDPSWAVARWLSGPSGGPEAAWSWINGGAAGLLLALLVWLNARIVGRRLALAAALAVAAAPLFLIGARLPCRALVEGAAAAWLLGRAFECSGAARSGRALRSNIGAGAAVAAAWVAGSLEVAALAGVLLAVGPPGLRAERSPRGALAFGALVAVVWTIWRRNAAVLAFDPVLATLAPPAAAFAAACAPSALLALTLFLRGSRTTEEAPAPLWLRSATAAVLIALGSGWSLGLPPTGAALLPLASLGLANLANRRTDPGAALGLVALAAVAALLTSSGLEVALRRWDRSAVTELSIALDGGALLAAQKLDAEARYLLRVRFRAQPEDVLAH